MQCEHTYERQIVSSLALAQWNPTRANVQIKVTEIIEKKNQQLQMHSMLAIPI